MSTIKTDLNLYSSESLKIQAITKIELARQLLLDADDLLSQVNFQGDNVSCDIRKLDIVVKQIQKAGQ